MHKYDVKSTSLSLFGTIQLNITSTLLVFHRRDCLRKTETSAPSLHYGLVSMQLAQTSDGAVNWHDFASFLLSDMLQKQLSDMNTCNLKFADVPFFFLFSESFLYVVHKL